MTNYQKLFNDSDMTYVDVAHTLGCCELTARNKISGKTRVTKAEEEVLNRLFDKNNSEGVDATCTILRHNR